MPLKSTVVYLNEKFNKIEAFFQTKRHLFCNAKHLNFRLSALLSHAAVIVENHETIQELCISSKAKKHIIYTIPETYFY